MAAGYRQPVFRGDGWVVFANIIWYNPVVGRGDPIAPDRHAGKTIVPTPAGGLGPVHGPRLPGGLGKLLQERFHAEKGIEAG